MATKADRKKWDSLHVAQAKAQAAESEYDLALARKYHASYQDSWLTNAQKDKKDRLREKRREIESKIIDLLVEISPRGDHWLSGAPAHWLATELTWEDAIRPANEQLSVVVPGSYGSPDGTVREARGTTMANKDAQEFKQFLDEAVILVAGDGDVIDLDDKEPVRVAIIVDVNGYGPHVGAIYAMQRGHVDEALQAADEILDEWTLDHYPASADDEYRTETFDGRSWTIPVEEFADAVEGTAVEKFIDIEGYEEEVEESNEHPKGRKVAKVRAWWDDQDSKNEGWYAMTYDDEGHEIDDSMKVWFPIDIDQFSSDEADELHDALKDAFPDAEIEVED